MFEVLFAHLEKKIALSEHEKEEVKTFFTAKKLRKKQYLLQAGDVCKYLSFVEKGLLRTYNVDGKGNEHMNLFGWEGWWVSDFSSFLTGGKAFFNIDAIEDSELLTLSLVDYEELIMKVPVMDRYFRILYQNSLMTKEQRLVSAITFTAEEKYVQLLDSHPALIQRIPQNLIASYLGIAPATLSRLKKQIANRK